MKEFPRIIGFTGVAGSGKSTAAGLLLRHYRGFSLISFADPIRRMLQELGVDSHTLAFAKHASSDFLCGRTPRYAMQTLGTEWGRALIGPDIWINASNRRLVHLLDMGSRAVFDDVRFDNEARMIRDAGGYIVDLKPAGGVERMAHASEAGVSPDLIDATIESGVSPDLFTARVLGHFNGFEAY
jgi:hypothetical protein